MKVLLKSAGARENQSVGVMIRSDTNLPKVTEGYNLVILD